MYIYTYIYIYIYIHIYIYIYVCVTAKVAKYAQWCNTWAHLTMRDIRRVSVQ